jgi:hypothetical protein
MNLPEYKVASRTEQTADSPSLMAMIDVNRTSIGREWRYANSASTILLDHHLIPSF